MVHPALHLIVSAGFGLAGAALVLVLLARLVRELVEWRRARASARVAAMRSALIRAAVTGHPVGPEALDWPLSLAAIALAQAAQRADPGMAARIARAAEPLRLRQHLERRLRGAGRIRRARAATALAWHPEGSAALRAALVADPSGENRYLIAQLLAGRGERPPVRLLARALGFTRRRPDIGVRLALNDRVLISDQALQRIDRTPGLPVPLRQLTREALSIRAARSSLAALGGG